MVDLENKRKTYEKWGKIIAFAILGFLVAPFIVATIQGMIGLLIAAAVGWAGIEVGLPWFGTKVANWRLQALKAEAAKNPIETMENHLFFRKQRLQQMRDAIKTFSAQKKNFAGQVDKLKKDHPGEEAVFEKQLKNMEDLLKNRIAKYERTLEVVNQFEKELVKARAKWAVAQAAAEVNKLAAVDAEAFMEEIKRDTALESIETNLNKAFAELEVAVVDERVEARNHAAAIPAQQSEPQKLPDGSVNRNIDLTLTLD